MKQDSADRMQRLIDSCSYRDISRRGIRTSLSFFFDGTVMDLV